MNQLAITATHIIITDAHVTLTSIASNQVKPGKASYCCSNYHTDNLHAPLTLSYSRYVFENETVFR